jgi:hypothetical protein
MNILRAFVKDWRASLEGFRAGQDVPALLGLSLWLLLVLRAHILVFESKTSVISLRRCVTGAVSRPNR